MKRLLFLLILALTIASAVLAADSDWKLVFQDNFDRATLGDNWTVVVGSGTIKDGKLVMTGGGGTVLYSKPTKPDVRFEFDVEAMPGNPPCDLSATIGGNLAHGTGYLLQFGGQDNRVNRIGGTGIEVSDTKPKMLIELGKKYHIIAQEEGGHFKYIVNGTAILEGTAKNPSLGPGFDRIGLVTWNGMIVDNFKLYERVPKHPNTPEYATALPASNLYRKGRKLVTRTDQGIEIEKAVKEFNSGNLGESLKLFKAAGGTTGLIGQAYVICDLSYNEKFEFHDGDKTKDFQYLSDQFVKASKANPGDAVLAAYTKAAVLMPELILTRSGVKNAIHLTALGTENNPFYYKARFYEARYLYWNALEGGNTRMRAEAIDWMNVLKKTWPEQTVLKQYTGEKVPWEENLNADTTRDPEWAAYLHEAYARDIRIMERFFTRQTPDGQLGGGYGDDCELMRTWMQVSAISTAGESTTKSIECLGEGIWQNVCKPWGYDSAGDVEHSSEPSADLFPGLTFLRYGNPMWIERNMASCKTIKEMFMMTDPKGYPRFKSCEYGHDKVITGPEAGGDCGYNGRPMKHFIWATWWGNPEAKDWFVRWADGWRAATMAETDGKMSGFVPPTIWPDGGIEPPGGKWKWWNSGANYYGCPGIWGMVVDSILAAGYFTGDPKFVQPFQIEMEYASSGPLYSHTGSFPSLEAQKASFYEYSDPQKISLYKLITGERSYDEYTLRYGDPAQVFKVNYDIDQFKKSFKSAAEGLRYNVDLATTEVESTDRAALGSPLTVFGAYTGAIMGMRDDAVPTFAVTYDTPDTNFAALVTENTTKRLRVRLYSFHDKDTKIGLKLWQLQPGNYIVNQGYAMDGERADQNRYSWDGQTSVSVRHRADMVYVTVPPHKEWVVDLRLDKPINVPATAPDMAIGKNDIVRSKDGLKVTVHNVGNADAKPFVVALQKKVDGAWKTISEQTISSLPTPKSFVPSTKTIAFKTDSTAKYRISIDPADKQYEICETNNVLVIN